jgi:hypothetical protein
VQSRYPDRTRTLIELFVDSDRHKELIDVCIKTPRKNKDGKDMKNELLVHIEDILMGRDFLNQKKYSIIQLSQMVIHALDLFIKICGRT